MEPKFKLGGKFMEDKSSKSVVEFLDMRGKMDVYEKITLA